MCSQLGTCYNLNLTHIHTAEDILAACPVTYCDALHVHPFYRWDKEEAVLKESNPNELHQVMPVIQVKPVTSDQYTREGYYYCPVYTNMQRANVYSPSVSAFTLRTAEPAHKWVLASVALLLQDDLA